MKLYELKFKELGCQCHVDDLGSILNENPECKYHNWLDDMYANDEDVTRTINEQDLSTSEEGMKV